MFSLVVAMQYFQALPKESLVEGTHHLVCQRDAFFKVTGTV
jgi:hypothetical protein